MGRNETKEEKSESEIVRKQKVSEIRGQMKIIAWVQESRQVIMFHFVMYDMIKLSIFCQILPKASSEFHVELLGENLKQ